MALSPLDWILFLGFFAVLVSFTLLPRFLKAGIYTMPEFLEYRYNPLARGIMAAITVVIYVGVLITAVLYTGAIALETLLDIDRAAGVWIIGAIGTLYAASGGLKAIAYADLIQGITLLVGGMLVFFLSLNAVGGWESFTTESADKLHMILPADHPELPWTSVAFGMWIVMIALTIIRPLDKPVTLPVRAQMELRTEPVVFITGGAVILHGHPQLRAGGAGKESTLLRKARLSGIFGEGLSRSLY